MFVLGLQGSPRKGGNTDTFLAAFMDRAAQMGAAVKTVQVSRAGIVPCKGCGYCEKHGTCVIADDPMSGEMYGLLRQADLVVAASPVYFYGISAQLKVFIDRCQTLWSRKYVIKLQDPLATTRKGLLFSVAASRGRQLFDGIHLTAKYFFDAIDARFDQALTYRGIEAKAAIRSHETLPADIDAAIEKLVLPLVARTKILFVSTQGVCRAPMAAAMAQRLFGERIRTDFAGVSPATGLHEPMVKSMLRLGVDLGYRRPQAIEEAFNGGAPDMIVAISDRPEEIPVGHVQTVNWPIAPTLGTDDQTMEEKQAEISEHIDQLMQRIQ